MRNIFSYLKKYQDTDFKVKEFNEVDAAILALLPYFNFSDIANTNEYQTLMYCFSKFLKTYKEKDFLNQGFDQINLLKLAKVLKDSSRYNSLLINNCVDEVTDMYQFGAMTIKLPDKTKVIAYKGTGVELVGWKEDFSFSYHFPSPACIKAVKYFHHHTNLLDKNIIILGHSKGGLLSVIAARYSFPLISRKIKKVYNFDGPGVLKKEYNNYFYQKVLKKVNHIIPKYSIIGLFLTHNNDYQVVETSKKGLQAHNIFTWQVENDSFCRTNLSNSSKNLDQSIVLWLDKYSYKEREEIIDNLFSYLENHHITNVIELKNIKNIFSLIKNRKEIDETTRNVLNDFLKFNYDYNKLKNEIELI